VVTVDAMPWPTHDPSQFLGDHRTLLQRVWGPQYADERNYLRTFAQRLLVKLEDDPPHPEIVVSVGRQGYRLGPPR
jgi:two-component system KDP operon response regulator KdpE